MPVCREGYAAPTNLSGSGGGDGWRSLGWMRTGIRHRAIESGIHRRTTSRWSAGVCAGQPDVSTGCGIARIMRFSSRLPVHKIPQILMGDGQFGGCRRYRRIGGNGGGRQQGEEDSPLVERHDHEVPVPRHP